MKIRVFTEEEIAEAPLWLADQMRDSNECEYYLRAAGQFIFLGFMGIPISFILIFTDKLWLAMAANGLALISISIGGRYNRKADKLINRQ